MSFQPAAAQASPAHLPLPKTLLQQLQHGWCLEVAHEAKCGVVWPLPHCKEPAAAPRRASVHSALEAITSQNNLLPKDLHPKGTFSSTGCADSALAPVIAVRALCHRLKDDHPLARPPNK